EKSAAAAGMYLEETVVGTILDAQRVYVAEEVEWYQCELRVDVAESEGSGVEVGDVLKVKYQVERKVSPRQKPGVGDQVRGTLRPPGEGPESVWEADSLTILGRGELVNAGDGAAVDLGSPEAKVLVKMFAPLGVACHQKTADLLKELGGREGERVRVQLFDMRQPEGRREMQRERIRCATVLINNRMKFTLEGEEGRREVVLSHRPNEARSSYNSEDVIAAAEGEMARLYSEEAAEEEKSTP
ncbi:MAG: hypothetical protein JSV79_08980, partial [Armatimonadota bacterium]